MKMLKLKTLKLKTPEKIIIGVLLVSIIVQAGIAIFTKSNNQNSNIVIKVNNKVEKKIPLINLSTSRIYKFNFNNNIGYIEVKNGKVRMLEMDKKICPNVICSNTGWIDKSYQSIICLPNKIVVTIEGAKNNKVDAVTS